MSIQASQSDLLREWIEKQFDEGKDLLKSLFNSKVKQDIQISGLPTFLFKGALKFCSTLTIIKFL